MSNDRDYTTDAQRFAWIARARGRLLGLALEDPALMTRDGLDTLLQFVEHLLERVRHIEAREGID